MWKNIGKGGIWFAVYFGLQNLFSTILAIAYIFMHPENIPEPGEIDGILNVLLDAISATIVPALITSALVMILIYFIHRKVTHQPLYAQSLNWQKSIFFVGLACILNVVCNTLLGFLQSMLPPAWVDALESSVGLVTTDAPFWMLLLCTGILVPIMEEITFRYGFQHYIAKSNVLAAYILSSIIFGVMHGNPIQIIYATIFGFILAFVYQKSGNLWYPIIIHAVNNTASLIATQCASDLVYITVFLIIGIAITATSIICFDDVKVIFKKPKQQ